MQTLWMDIDENMQPCEYRRRRKMNTMNGGSAEKMTVDQKLELLRTKMKERGMDAYMVPTADFHESEYVGDHFKCRQFLTVLPVLRELQ